MGKDEKEGAFKRLLKSIPGMKTHREEQDRGNSYEFEATIGKKGDSLGFTFDKVSQALGRIRHGMKARVIMVREPGKSWYWARIQFIEPEERKESVS